MGIRNIPKLKKYHDYGLKVDTFDYIHDISQLYNKSDLVICRAGSNDIKLINFL